MSPSGLHLRPCKIQSYLQTLRLTPNGVSTNLALDFIIEVLEDSSVTRFDCRDAYENKVLVYFDTTGFVRDYLASSSVIDVSGDTAIFPRTHSWFVLSRNIGMSTHVFTISISHSDTAYRWAQNRSFTIRALQPTKENCKNLELSFTDEDAFSERGKESLLKPSKSFNLKLKTLN